MRGGFDTARPRRPVSHRDIGVAGSEAKAEPQSGESVGFGRLNQAIGRYGTALKERSAICPFISR